MVQQFFLFCGSQQFFHVSPCTKTIRIPQLPRLSRCQLKKSLVLITTIGGQLFLDAVTVTVTDQPKPQGEEYVFSLTNMVKWKFQLVMNVMYPQQYINHQPCNRPAANRQWISPMPSDEPLACLLHKKPEVSGTKMLFWMHTKTKKFRLFCCTLFLGCCCCCCCCCCCSCSCSCCCCSCCCCCCCSCCCCSSCCCCCCCCCCCLLLLLLFFVVVAVGFVVPSVCALPWTVNYVFPQTPWLEPLHRSHQST